MAFPGRYTGLLQNGKRSSIRCQQCKPGLIEGPDLLHRLREHESPKNLEEVSSCVGLHVRLLPWCQKDWRVVSIFGDLRVRLLPCLSKTIVKISRDKSKI